jgi:hypothetical protein
VQIIKHIVNKYYHRYQRFSQQQLDLIAGAYPKVSLTPEGENFINRYQFCCHEQLLAVSDLQDLVNRLVERNIIGFSFPEARQLYIYYSQAQDHSNLIQAAAIAATTPFVTNPTARPSKRSPNGKYRHAKITMGYPARYTRLIEEFAGQVLSQSVVILISEEQIRTKQLQQLLKLEQARLNLTMGGSLDALEFILNNTGN